MTPRYLCDDEIQEQIKKARKRLREVLDTIRNLEVMIDDLKGELYEIEDEIANLIYF